MAGIVDVIKYEGDNETFIWKHPLEDFVTGTQLIVHESQEAIFFMNGQALDTFEAGRYTLDTENIPLIGRLFNLATGKKSPFHCEVYFVNKTEQMAIKWGTDSRLEFLEPQYKFPIQIGACGEMSMRVEDGRKLLIKVVGTGKEGAVITADNAQYRSQAGQETGGISQEGLVKKFRAFLMTYFKTYLTQLITENQLCIFEIDSYLAEMSKIIHDQMCEHFSEYGVVLENFFISNILKPEDDPSYKRFKDLHFRQYADIAEAKLRQQVAVIEQQTGAQKTVIEAESIARKRSVEGYSYQEERRFDVAETVAANEAVGQFTNMGVGMGMITGISAPVSGAVGSMMAGAVNNAVSSPAAASGTAKCVKCGASLPENAKFCMTCGEKTEPSHTENTMIVCPNCGKSVMPGKFCFECGSPLALSCSNCGKTLPAGSKFCPDCGTKV